MTPLYASPEQIASIRDDQKGKREPITRATDIWSLGLTLLETLVRKATWQPGQVAHILDKPKTIWLDVIDLLRRMLARDPAERPKVAEHAAGAVRGTRAVARASRAVRDTIREIGSFKA